MAISFQPTKDFSRSADITFNNMRTYYEYYSVDWKQPKILEQIFRLENWDIIYDGKIVGAIRLQFDFDGCYLRDLQVSEEYQNQGIGAAALQETMRIASRSGASQLKLRVFKISPAYGLYIRSGFTVSGEDEKFFNMVQQINY